jgi:tetratricopeptide (TPR) repeat protein
MWPSIIPLRIKTSEAVIGQCRRGRFARRTALLSVALLCLRFGMAPAADPAAAPPSRQAETPAPHSAEADAAAYDRCMTLAREDPAAAKKFAEGWHEEGSKHPAQHCAAVALFGLKQYAEAAGRLEALAQDMLQSPVALRADVLEQAAQAWLLAGNPARAYGADSLALGLRPGDPDLLVDRAEAAGAAHWYDKAIADLDRVLTATPTRVDALVYRGSAYRALGRLDASLADLDKALAEEPDSAAALLERGNLLSLKGDLAGAQRDWARVAAVAPGSPAAAAAASNLERLAKSPEGTVAAPPAAHP